MEINFDIKIKTVQKEESNVTSIGIPVSFKVRDDVKELKDKGVPVNDVLREVLKQLIKQHS